MDRKWRLRGIFGVLAALAIAGLLGFIVLPVVQGRAAGIDAYTALCRAIGILPGSPARQTPSSEAATGNTSILDRSDLRGTLSC